MAKSVTMTLKREVPVHPWDDETKSPPLAVGSTFTLKFAPGILHVGTTGFVDYGALLNGAATVPCPHLADDYCDCGAGYGCSHGGWYWCRRFMHSDRMTNVCRGDMCSCPSSKVRAEAAATGSPTGER